MFLSFNPQIQQKTYNEYTTTNQTITIGEMQGCKLVLPLTTMNSSIAMVGNIANYLYCCVCIHYSKEGWCIPKYLGQQSTCTRCPRRWYLCFKFGLLNVSIQPIHLLLGENIVIIKEPQLAIKLKPDWVHWPNLLLSQSSLANGQNFFRGWTKE